MKKKRAISRPLVARGPIAACVTIALALASCHGSDIFSFGPGGPCVVDDNGCTISGGSGGETGPSLSSGSSGGPRPSFGKTVTLASAPPPISGGTLLLASEPSTAVAADPDRNQIYVVDLSGPTLLATLPLSPGDEPGRLVEDGHQRVHVALRGGGAVVTIDLASRAIVDRRAVCPAPRGIAFDAASDDLFVACNGGELVTLPAAGGPASRTLHLVTDLRDIVVRGSSLLVSRFRQAEVLEIDSSGAVVDFGAPHAGSAGSMAPDMAWRMVATPPIASLSPAGVAIVHQRAQLGAVNTDQGGYGQSGSGCPGTSIVETTITTFTGGLPDTRVSPSISAAVLPVDLAVSPDGAAFAVVAAGNAKTASLPGVFFLSRRSDGSIFGDGLGCATDIARTPVPGQATAVALVSSTIAWVQTREPAALVQVRQTSENEAKVISTLTLSSIGREDTGHSIVHSNSGGFIACASCHGEGGDDAHVWQFATSDGESSPARRTQSMRGTIAGTAPYHWEGDMKDIPTLAHEVFVKRMGGQSLSSGETTALEAWLDAVPRAASSPAADPDAAAAGQALFTSVQVGCSGCHAGEHFTNNQTLDVGTGGKFQVPSLLGVGWRAPYFHDGRAPQLLDRFDPALAGDLHGHTSQLTTAQIDDLVAYLQTL